MQKINWRRRQKQDYIVVGGATAHFIANATTFDSGKKQAGLRPPVLGALGSGLALSNYRTMLRYA
jgi:hypothetical protein